jgi:Fe-S cluster assembly iron-binding protein IscA
MLTLTQGARLAIISLTEPTTSAGDAGVRIAAAAPIDANEQGPQLGLEVAAGPAPGDQIIDEDGARVFLDESAASLLDDQTLDVEIDEVAQRVNFYVT